MVDCQKIFEERHPKYGVILLELWPEGLVFWVGGEIRWRSYQPTGAALEFHDDIARWAHRGERV